MSRGNLWLLLNLVCLCFRPQNSAVWLLSRTHTCHFTATVHCLPCMRQASPEERTTPRRRQSSAWGVLGPWRGATAASGQIRSAAACSALASRSLLPQAMPPPALHREAREEDTLRIEGALHACVDAGTPLVSTCPPRLSSRRRTRTRRRLRFALLRWLLSLSFPS